MIWNNVLTWSLQIALLVSVAAVGAAVLRLRVPAARLFYWQMALLACLALPVARPWKQEVVTGTVSVSTRILQVVETPADRLIPPEQAALWLILAGALVRTIWLSAGFWRLRQYRRRSVRFDCREGVALLLSHDIAGPVTWGVRCPVVLLPSRFPELEPRMREAILCHELLHVRRRDWLFTLAEELVRTVFWFHPAVWWLQGQIQLAREQTVDRQVVEMTSTPEEYVDALLAIAGQKARLDLVPAPLFMRKRHLKQRVVSILKEVRMSKMRLVSSLAAGLGILVAACWAITAALPLAAAPQVVADAPGVTVEIGGATLMHRTPVAYPEAARKQKAQGTVIVQIKVDRRGDVADAQVLSGPDELRKAALQSVLNWHFMKDAAGTTRQVSLSFQLPAETVKAASSMAAPAAGPLAQAARLPEAAARGQMGQPLKGIAVVGLSDQARAELLARLPVREGDLFGPTQSLQTMQAIKDFDEHLAVAINPSSGLTVGPREALEQALPLSAATTDSPSVPQRIRIGGNLQATKLVSKIIPIYPPLAKQARIQGTVSLNALIGKDGTVQNLTVISGDPLLVPAVLESVPKWVYQPTLLNGNPVEVISQIDVNFTLSQ